MSGCAKSVPYPSYDAPDRTERNTNMTFTADDARRLFQEATDLNGEVARQETTAVLNKIEAASRRAERSITISLKYEHRDLVTRRLQAAGFTVRTVPDSRDGDYTTVTW